ncbi:GAF domain-containing protein [Prevotella sp.]|uniref:GAF domain-containing protein n=1 Tax=Prevotella sp. TaxID=59823 RepID=UPI0025D7ADC9|nr:GAF domain-containing protein [Prevotella sp.]MCI7370830.1 GAF domain-containing protein [Prevotella sp.]
MDKQSRYRELLSQIEVFANADDNPISVLSNCAAVMKVVFQKEYFWVGFYIVDGDELILGPFQGTPACTRIKFGRGVCGIAWKEGRSLVVEDVEEFPGHIACSSLSRSEIVVPLFSDGVVIGEIDIDSTELATFDDVDREYLEKAAEKIAPFLAKISKAASCKM